MSLEQLKQLRRKQTFETYEPVSMGATNLLWWMLSPVAKPKSLWPEPGKNHMSLRALGDDLGYQCFDIGSGARLQVRRSVAQSTAGGHQLLG